MDEWAKKRAKVVRGTLTLVVRDVLGSFIGIFYFARAVAARELGVEGMAVVSAFSMVYTLIALATPSEVSLSPTPNCLRRWGLRCHD